MQLTDRFIGMIPWDKFDPMVHPMGSYGLSLGPSHGTSRWSGFIIRYPTILHGILQGAMAGGENPGPGRPGRDSARCLLDDLRVFRGTEGSTQSSPLVFGVETVLLPTAAKKGGKRYRGVVETAECFMTRWHSDEAESSWLRHAAEDAKSDDKGRGGQ